MTKRNVMIRMLTSRLELGASLFDDAEDEECEACEECEEELPNFDLAAMLGEMPEPDEMLTEGRLVTTETRVELIWEESELTGMAGSITAVGFHRNNPALISMMRTGTVRTAMTFEEGKRHYCLYNTPYSDFEVCVRAVRVENRLLSDGVLNLDYLVEIHGAQAEHCRMNITVKNRE
ncbi:MAG: DUF1934 domain-containing protein [Clostridia bacterium]|nr:DUF1934 domain-containing protein [Clostridia bacterium]